MNRIVSLLLGIQFFNVIANNLLTPIYAVYVKNIGGNLVTAGTSLAINHAVIGTCAIISGKIAEKYKSERIQLVIGCFLGVLTGIGYLLISTPLQLYLLQILAGLSYATAQPSFGGIFSAKLEKKFSSGWGYYFGITYWAGALAYFYSGYVSEVFGFNFLFISLIIAQLTGLLGAIYIYFKVKL